MAGAKLAPSVATLEPAKIIASQDSGSGGEFAGGGSEPKNDEPKSSGNNGRDKIATVNPAELGGGENIGGDRYERDDAGNIILKADGTPRKKRGRKAGQTISGISAPIKTTRNKTADSINNLADTLKVMHSGIALFSGFSDFALDDDEAKQLAKSGANFIEQFEVEINPKVTAAGALVTTAAMIYGPRFYLYKEFRKAKKQSAKILPDEIVQEMPEGESGHIMNSFDLAG